MKARVWLGMGVVFVGSFLCVGGVFSQESELSSYKLWRRSTFFVGYENNVKLSPHRKGDIFEQYLYSIRVSKPWVNDIVLHLDYDFDFLNYSEITDATNMLNHLQLSVHKTLPFCHLDLGYDMGAFYYPRNEENTFLLHSGFLSFKRHLSDSLYHKIQFAYGFKDYTERNALSDTLSTFQDKERLDRRYSASYTVAAIVSERLLMRLRTKFSLNNSNARYLDFYDYRYYQQRVSFDYKLYKNIFLTSNLFYARKLYKARTITGGTDKQKDNLYAISTGLTYILNKKNSFSLTYTYRENASNDNLEDYSESVIVCGWQYRF